MARVALVTGGTRGIGAAVSTHLQAAGRRVVASYAGNDAAAEAFTRETGIAAVKFDAGDFGACEAALARIAFAAETHGRPHHEGAPVQGLGVRIVPVAITYLVRHAFRSDIHVAFGPAIAVAEVIGAAATRDEGAAVRELTARIGDALRELAVHVERTEDERLIAQAMSSEFSMPRSSEPWLTKCFSKASANLR